MQVEVTIGVQQPGRYRGGRQIPALWHRHARAVKGGLDVPEEGKHDKAVIASAAIAVRFDLP